MLQITQIRENKELVIERLAIKNIDASTIIEDILNKDKAVRQNKVELESIQAEQNNIAKEIGELFKSGKREEADARKARSVELKESGKLLEEKSVVLEQELYDILVTLPNLPSSEVPKGVSAEDNTIIYQSVTDLPTLFEGAIPHWEITSKYDIIDFELGTKVTGAGFPVYKGKGAKLQRALINFFLDQAEENGYKEIQPPILINEASGFGTGQLPDKEGQMYHVGIDGFYLIPTAEVPVTNLFRDTILKAEEMPVKYCAYTPCFRREAGSYGAHVRGLNRLHQFDKVEIVQVALPETSYDILEQMKSYVCTLLEKLELPYRVLRLCGGDMSFSSALTYDMEVWSAAQQRWLEVSSVSNFETFQSNRLKLRYREGSGKPTLAHTLNGSALALPRIVAAILENNQTPNGVKVPKVLLPYLKFDTIN